MTAIAATTTAGRAIITADTMGSTGAGKEL